MKYEIYKNAEFGEIRTMDINGEPWFVGADVAKADRKSTRLNSSHNRESRMPSSA